MIGVCIHMHICMRMSQYEAEHVVRVRVPWNLQTSNHPVCLGYKPPLTHHPPSHTQNIRPFPTHIRRSLRLLDCHPVPKASRWQRATQLGLQLHGHTCRAGISLMCSRTSSRNATLVPAVSRPAEWAFRHIFPGVPSRPRSIASVLSCEFHPSAWFRNRIRQWEATAK